MQIAHLLRSTAVLAAHRAYSARRLVAFACAGLPSPVTLASVTERRAAWLAQGPPSADVAARRLLVAEDLGPLLELAPSMGPRVSAWEDPQAALATALDRIVERLGALGLEMSRPALYVHETLPSPYADSGLAVVNFGRDDGAHFAQGVGIHVALGRLFPGFGELALGHVAIHHALNERSPTLLGRGLEEGLAELLGGLHIAAETSDADLVRAAFASLRLTPSRSSWREELLERVAAAAVIHRRYGMEGIVALVRRGREGIKSAERLLASGRLDALGLPDGKPDPDLVALLDRLTVRPRPRTIGALSFYLGRSLQRGTTVAAAGKSLGVPQEAAQAAARALASETFALVLGDSGEVLTDDLALLFATGELRYELPRPTSRD